MVVMTVYASDGETVIRRVPPEEAIRTAQRMKQRRARLRDGFNDEQAVNPTVSPGINGSQAATRRDACRAVRSAILELTPVQREAIELSYFEGMTQKEIALQLGEPLGTVKARIRRGLAKLKDTVDTD